MSIFSSSFDIVETSIFTPLRYKSLPLLLLPTPFCQPLHRLDEFDAISDLIQIYEPAQRTTTRRVFRRLGLGQLYLGELCDRVTDLELGFEHLLLRERAKKKTTTTTKKYTWTAEIESPDKDRKCKWTAEVKDDENELNKSYKCTAQIKSGQKEDRTYTVKISGGDHNTTASDSEEESDSNKEKKKKGKRSKDRKSKGSSVRVVEIEEPSNHGAIVLKQVFAKRMEKRKGKRKDLSAQDAAIAIQLSFREYMIRRSQALRALRELAIAKSKLKEIRGLFNNFTYRRRLIRDAEERQRFSEKIIVLLLTVDAIEGADLMVRVAKKPTVEELEAMLDVVDPQPPGKSWYVTRRMFDMPDVEINQEIAAGVAHVVQMLEEEPESSETFEACL